MNNQGRVDEGCLKFEQNYHVSVYPSDPRESLIWLNPKEKDGGAGESRTPDLRFRNTGGASDWF